jgi:hypothetical protein
MLDWREGDLERGTIGVYFLGEQIKHRPGECRSLCGERPPLSFVDQLAQRLK